MSVATQWNSLAKMLSLALYLCKPLDALVVINKHNNIAKTAFCHLKLSSTERFYQTLCHPLWCVFALCKAYFY